MRKLAMTVLFCLFAGVLYGQSPNATLTGRVTDPAKDVIADAKITVVNDDTGIRTAASTNQTGSYNVPELLPGNYHMEVEKVGFRAVVKTGIVLHVQEAVEINFELAVGSVTESVTVAAEQVQVELTTSSISGVISQTEVVELPLNGRDWTSLATLQPAVNQVLTQQPSGSQAHRGTRGNGVQMAISGTRPQHNNYRIDGISVVDYAGGGPGSVIGAALGVDAVAEFSVLTSNYEAEYGRTSGGVVNAITRSGSNQIHGDAYEFIRNSDLDARNFFDTAGKPQFKRNQFGAAVGFPIQKDRTFLFADYEGFRQRLGLSFSDIVPSPNARNGTIVNPNGTTSTITVNPSIVPYLPFWPLPNSGLLGLGNTGRWIGTGTSLANDNFGTARVDRKFSDKDSVFGTFLYDRGLGNQSDALNTVLTGNTSSRELITVGENHAFTPSLINAVRIGLSEVHSTDSTGLSAINPLAADKSLGTFVGVRPAPGITVTGITGFGGGVGAIGQTIHNWASGQVYDDAFLSRGAHTLKFGFAFERMRENFFVDPSRPNGTFTFGSLTAFLQNQPTTFQGGIPGSSFTHNLRQSLFGGYFQDDWRARPNLTVNLGLRYEAVTVPTDKNGRLVNLPNFSSPTPNLGSPYFNNPTLRNFEPRVGLSWDPFHNGKTAVRAAFGMFDVLPLFFEFQQSLNSQFPFAQAVTAGNLTAGSFPTGAVALAGVKTSSLTSASIEFNPPRNYVMIWNLNIQQQLTSDTSLMVGYVGNHGVHMLDREDDVNQVLPVSTTPEGLLWPFPAGSGTKLNPNWGSIRGEYWDGDSEYDALEVQVSKKLTHGFLVQGSFTWQKGFDEGSASLVGDPFTNSISSLFFFCKTCRRGVSDFNIKRTLVFNYVWNLPGPKNWGALAGHALGGWQLGGIFTAEDGLPVTPLIGGDPLGLNSSDPYDFPVRLTGSACTSLVNPGNVANYINLSCFGLPAATPDIVAQCTPFSAVPGTCRNVIGTGSIRNIVTGPGLTNLDFSLFKNNYIRRISESFNAQFRIEMFNVFNHPNFGTPVDNETLFQSNGNPVAGAGSLDLTSTTQREIQFALKLIW
jgi:outer membrane receptor protein involved in Fe transport